MKYDFDCIHTRRNTDSVKWDGGKTIFGSEDVIPMWVADMDFPTAAPIVEALKRRADQAFFGYTQPGPGLIDAVVDRMKRKFDWDIRPEWIVFAPGVIPAISFAIRSLTRPGDEIILQEPAYYPFFSSVALNGCRVVTNPLSFNGRQYDMDFDHLESLFSPVIGMRDTPRRIRALVLCNPHNPVGRIWNKEELTRMGQIVIGKGAVVISDEIHCELRFNAIPHTPFASISKTFEQNVIVCMAPSKTFNLPGLAASSIIIPNPVLREGFRQAHAGVAANCNLFGLAAMEAAYRHGDEWLEQVLDYIQANVAFAVRYFEQNIPAIKPVEPQGTYLLWLDCRALGMNDMALRKWMREEARVGLDDGFLFGEGGSGFQRMNLACPRAILEEALARIERAARSL